MFRASFHLFANGAEGFGFLVGNSLGGPGNTQSFNDHANFSKMERLFEADNAHARAAIWNVLKEAFVHEVHEGGPNGAAACAQ